MRRFFAFAVLAVLMALVAAPARAGYIVIRILLESSNDPGLDSAPSGPSYAMGGYGMGGTSSFSPAPGGKMGTPVMGYGSGSGMPKFGQPGGTGKDAGKDAGKEKAKPVTEGEPYRSLVVVIPVNSDLTVEHPFDASKPPNADSNPRWNPVLRLTHRGTNIRTNLFADSATVQWYENLLKSPAYMITHDQVLEENYAKWAKTKKDSKLLYDTILSALQWGFVDLAVKYSDDLAAAVGDKTDGLRPEIASFVKTYKAMQSGIKGTPQKPGRGEFWKARLGARDVLNRGHYSLVYFDTPSDEVQRRASLLEENFRAFYLMHAVWGVELPVPETPLVAVLAKRGADVLPMVAALDAPTNLRADGAYSPEHDVLVLSPQRLDGLGQSFVRQVQQIYQGGASRDQLLAGKGPKISTRGAEGTKKPDEVAWMQTMALVERFVDENSAVYATSREGSRQLLYATGQLPRYVQLPTWLVSGTGNSFARPRDPAFVTDEKGHWQVSVATATGYGVPNPTLQRYFRDLTEKKELHPDRAQLLKNVLTDAYFLGLRNPKEVNDPDPQKVDTSGIALHTGGTGGNVPAPPGTGGTTRPPGYGGTVGPSPMPGYGGTVGPAPGGTGGRPIPGGGGSAYGPPGGGGSAYGPPGGGGSAYGPPPLRGVAGGGGGMGDPTMTQPTSHQDDAAIVKLRRSRERLLTKAETTSWALCYYLSRERPREFKRFADELAMLPRDLPLDGTVVTAAFAKAFNLDGSPESFRRFADGWLDYMGLLTRGSQDIELHEAKAHSSGTTTGGGMPMIPGGMPPGGGAGPTPPGGSGM